MKKIIGYLRDYFQMVDKRVLVLSLLFISLAIFVNYYNGLNKAISTFSELKQFVSWFFIFLIAFSFSYIILAIFKRHLIFQNKRFLSLLFIAPALFAWKMTFDTNFAVSRNTIENAYWNQVIYWPFKLMVITMVLFIIWKIYDRHQPFYGVSVRNLRLKPYFIMLLIMLPLIAAASTQPDFLAVYPKLKNISYLIKDRSSGWYRLLYELSYGSDFFSIELFFRGFLVLAFIKWAGKDAILPMACFYCTIHFGKPAGECISSFFGGVILGIITYHTRSIFGGLMVHLGIAWMMELGGYLGAPGFTPGP